jgi:hypothetical protein
VQWSFTTEFREPDRWNVRDAPPTFRAGASASHQAAVAEFDKAVRNPGALTSPETLRAALNGARQAKATHGLGSARYLAAYNRANGAINAVLDFVEVRIRRLEAEPEGHRVESSFDAYCAQLNDFADIATAARQELNDIDRPEPERAEEAHGPGGGGPPDADDEEREREARRKRRAEILARHAAR